MYIKTIEIKNFRNFSDFNIHFTKGFQTIVGENNIGKSNLFWAIRLVLDKDLSYSYRKLEEKDFSNFPKLNINSFISISVELYGEDLADLPNFHILKTTTNTLRVSYIFAHKSKISTIEEDFEEVNIKDFRWQLYGGGDSFSLDSTEVLNSISLNDINGINLYYISGFRDIKNDLFGNTKSLLTSFCNTRENFEEESNKIKAVYSKATKDLNKFTFIPEIKKSIQDKTEEISGEHFSVPISLGFLSEEDSNVWNKLKIYFSPNEDKNIPINSLGLGQKNLLYLSLYLSKLINSEDENEINVVLIEEPEAHLHPQLQKILFTNLKDLGNTQVFMSSHSTHIASDCDYKNLNIVYKNTSNVTKSFSPFNKIKSKKNDERKEKLLKRYLDATRSELFFSSGVILVEGVAEQFIIPAIAKQKFKYNLTEFNISLVPIHSRYFDPFLELFQNNRFEIKACAIIDGDSGEHEQGESTTSVENARSLEINDRVKVFEGGDTLEIDLFPDKETNKEYLKNCFYNLGHKNSYENLIASDPENWKEEIIKRIDNTIKKGRFAQELSLLIDEKFIVPKYIKKSLSFMLAEIIKKRKDESK